MKKFVAFMSTLLVALLGLASLAGCGGGYVDYAKGEKPSEGLEFHHISELDSGAFVFTYSDWIKDDDYYVATGLGTCTDKIVVMPSEYNGKPVKAVADRAFFRAEVEGFIFPNTMEVLGELSIRGGGLKVLKGNGIRVYGGGCTGGCLIENVVLSQKTEYAGQWSFFFSTGPKTIWIPKTLKKFGPQPFMDSSYETIYYEGSEADWKKIEYEAGECDFPDIKVEYNVKYPGIK